LNTPVKAHVAGLTLISCLLSTGCQKEVCTEPLSPDAVILAFGDSLTTGFGADSSTSYPAVLQELTDLKVINAGVSGETTDRGLQRLEEELESYSPELLILLEGGNDMLRRKGLDNLRSNLQQMVAIAQENNTQVLMLAVPEPRIITSPPKLYEEIAEASGIPLMSDIVTDLLFDRDYKSDPIHLNEAGYRRLAEVIFQKLNDCGSLP
jgi:acyl-CoA thioesterase I